MDEEKVTVELTRTQCRELASMYEFNLLDVIRRDEAIDNIRWVRAQIDAYDALCHACGIPDSKGEK